MCDYCQGEGCSHGTEGSSTCQCDIIGNRTCASCGCQCNPWWSGLKLSRSATGEGAIVDLLWDNNDDSGIFPATKEKLVETLSEQSRDDAQWVAENLPSRIFKDAGDLVSALIPHLPPIQWTRGATDLLWKYPTQTTASGQKLVVGEKEQAIMVTSDGKKACDAFTMGSYTISSANCPLIASQSRKATSQFQGLVFDGSPVFLSPSMEFEIDLMVNGQTRALRRAMAKGIARVRISSPRPFLEQIASNGNFATESTLSNLKKYCTELLQKEISLHEMDELKNNGPLLEKVLTEGLVRVGLEPVKISFDFVGDFGPGAFMPSPSQMSDPQRMAQLKQMTDSMRATQMAQIEAIRAVQVANLQRMQQPASVTPPSAANLSPCPSCKSPNPSANKFCNSCGAPLLPSKRTCPKCGQQFDPSIKFCGNCGTKLS